MNKKHSIRQMPSQKMASARRTSREIWSRQTGQNIVGWKSNRLTFWHMLLLAALSLGLLLICVRHPDTPSRSALLWTEQARQAFESQSMGQMHLSRTLYHSQGARQKSEVVVELASPGQQPVFIFHHNQRCQSLSEDGLLFTEDLSTEQMELVKAAMLLLDDLFEAPDSQIWVVQENWPDCHMATIPNPSSFETRAFPSALLSVWEDRRQLVLDEQGLLKRACWKRCLQLGDLEILEADFDWDKSA